MSANIDRALLDHERLILQRLAPSLVLQGMTVRDLGDGMGSIVFVGANRGEKRSSGSCQFLDRDGFPVIIDLFVWDDGQPAELAFWKVDYSAVETFPSDSAGLTSVRYANVH